MTAAEILFACGFLVTPLQFPMCSEQMNGYVLRTILGNARTWQQNILAIIECFCLTDVDLNGV